MNFKHTDVSPVSAAAVSSSTAKTLKYFNNYLME